MDAIGRNECLGEALDHLAFLYGTGTSRGLFDFDPDTAVHVIAVQPGRRVGFGGAFTQATSLPHNVVARAGVLDSADCRFDPSVDPLMFRRVDARTAAGTIETVLHSPDAEDILDNGFEP